MDTTTQLENANVMVEKSVDWAISSQAPQECGEGSTTKARSPERAVKPHERGAGKVCSKCKQLKIDFHLKQVWCKECVKAYDKAMYAKKRTQILEKKKTYRAEKKESIAEGQKKWADANPEYRAKYLKAYKVEYINRPGVRAARNQERRERNAAVKQATPSWANKDAIRVFYIYARAMTEMFRTPYHVDHIVPLKGVNVCGLHTEANLQVLTGSQNSIKKNKLLEDIV